MKENKMVGLAKAVVCTFVCGAGLLAMACTNPREDLKETSGYFSSYEGFTTANSVGVEKIRNSSGADAAQTLSKYTKFLINPVTVWKNGNETRFQNISDEDLKIVTDLFRQELVNAVDDAYPVVDSPAADVLQIDVALTGIIASDPTLDGALIVVPFMPFVTKTEELITGNQSYVGATSIEGTMKDSLTGEELLAFIDTNIGKRIFEVSADDDLNDPYRYTKKAFQTWADRLRLVMDKAHMK